MFWIGSLSMSKIFEFFGYLATDRSDVALETAAKYHCPFLNKKCTKLLKVGASGVCALSNLTENVICCPNRLYGDDYLLLKIIAQKAFGKKLNLYVANEAVEKAKVEGGAIAVFGHEWGGELHLSQRKGTGNYFMDWVLVVLDNNGEVDEFTAIEVQTIDTTGNYQAGRESLLKDRSETKVHAGFNWENVNKRIIPQIIYKGQVLQRESKCKSGMFFVCNRPVFNHVIDRLGGREKLPIFPKQPASVTFIAYDYAKQASDWSDGKIMPLEIVDEHCTTVYKIQEAFSSIELPEGDVYLKTICKTLYEQ